VTVLFADVKGSMDLAEQVDPEEWHKIMVRFFAILSEGVHRFEGTIKPVHGRRDHRVVRRADCLAARRLR
jgi:class 3 adenylate cyclase